jgi:hypothetical protein
VFCAFFSAAQSRLPEILIPLRNPVALVFVLPMPEEQFQSKESTYLSFVL